MNFWIYFVYIALYIFIGLCSYALYLGIMDEEFINVKKFKRPYRILFRILFVIFWLPCWVICGVGGLLYWIWDMVKILFR